MSRKRIPFIHPSERNHQEMVARLALELKTDQGHGQPIIEEQVFPNGKLKVTVFWDDWDRLPLEQRTDIIHRAYGDQSGQIALANGLTIPEAHAAGMLPYQIIPAVRPGDPVNLDQCHKAMIEEGASILFGKDKPILRFSSQQEAEAGVQRLTQRLPRSDAIWTITQEMGRVEDWLQV